MKFRVDLHDSQSKTVFVSIPKCLDEGNIENEVKKSFVSKTPERFQSDWCIFLYSNFLYHLLVNSERRQNFGRISTELETLSIMVRRWTTPCKPTSLQVIENPINNCIKGYESILVDCEWICDTYSFRFLNNQPDFCSVKSNVDLLVRFESFNTHLL